MLECVLECGLDFGVAEGVSELECAPGEGFLSGEDGVGEFSEEESEGEGGYGEECGASECACECACELCVGDGVGCGGVDGAVCLRVVEGPEEEVDGVVEVDPGHPLFAGSEGASEAEFPG